MKNANQKMEKHIKILMAKHGIHRHDEQSVQGQMTTATGLFSSSGDQPQDAVLSNLFLAANIKNFCSNKLKALLDAYINLCSDDRFSEPAKLEFKNFIEDSVNILVRDNQGIESLTWDEANSCRCIIEGKQTTIFQKGNTPELSNILIILLQNIHAKLWELSQQEKGDNSISM